MCYIFLLFIDKKTKYMLNKNEKKKFVKMKKRNRNREKKNLDIA